MSVSSAVAETLPPAHSTRIAPRRMPFRVGLGLKISGAFVAAALFFGLAIIPTLDQLGRLQAVQTRSQLRSTGVRALLEMNVSGRDEAVAVSNLLLQGTGGDNSPVIEFRTAAARKRVWQAAARAVAETDQEKAYFSQLDAADKAFEDNFGNQLLPAIQSANRDTVNAASLLSDSYLSRIQRLSEQIIASYLDSERTTAQELAATSTTTYIELAVFTVAGIILHIIFIILITRSVLSPLRRLGDDTRRVARGELYTTPTVQTDDEVGDLARDFATMVLELRQIVGQVQFEIQQIENAAFNILSTSHEQVAGSSEQIVAARTIATTITQLSDRADDIAESAELVAQVAEQAHSSTQIGQKAVNAVVAGLDAIRTRAANAAERSVAVNHSLHEVSRILSAINEIAEETHLLAVNATIEASGAGAYGRRFGVIADEVSALSDRSKAAAQVAATIIGSVNATGAASVAAAQQNMTEIERGAVLVERNKQSFTDITAVIDHLAQLATSIKQATHAQRESVRQSVAMAYNIRQVAELTAQQSDQSAHAARNLSAIAAQLHTSTYAFHLTAETDPAISPTPPALLPADTLSGAQKD